MSDAMREALEKFTGHYEPWMDQHSDDDECIVHSRHTFGDLRRARAALAPQPLEAVAWSYEVKFGEGWARYVSFHKPSGNKWQRNITPLYAAPSPALDPITVGSNANIHAAPSSVMGGTFHRPLCKLCGLEDGACICTHIAPSPALSPATVEARQKSAPVVLSSLPSGESDPSVTLDYAGADTALIDANWKDAEEFCKGSFGHFVSDVSQYTKIVAELLQHATDRALLASPAPSGEPVSSTNDTGGK